MVQNLNFLDLEDRVNTFLRQGLQLSQKGDDHTRLHIVHQFTQ